MAKPILIIKVPVTVTEEDGEKQKNLIQERVNGEYHVIYCRCLTPSAEMKFECVGFKDKQ